MAGSLAHIVDDETGEFRMDLIENMGDAHEALKECFAIIHELTDGSRDAVNEVCDRLGCPTIQRDMVKAE